MPSTPSVDLTLVAAEDMASFFNTCKSIFNLDMDKQTPPVPPYNEVMVARAAKTADGRIAGGIVGKVLWNSFEVVQLAVNPECRVAGTEEALMMWAEDAARHSFACNQIFLGAFSWRPRDMFEKLGYSLQWEHKNYPRGHSRYYMEKVWSMESNGEPVHAHDAATADVHMEEWDAKDAAAQLQTWAEADRLHSGAGDVPPFAKEAHALLARLSDGTLAAQCLYAVTWNVLYVDILVVVPSGQRRGVGSAMLQKIADLARHHGCDDVYLQTMSWQARPFYERNGFTHVATQHNLPMGHKRYCMLYHVPQEASSAL